MKTTLQNFFKSKKNKLICFSILVFTILASAGFYLNLQAQEQKKQDQARIEKEKAEEEAKKEQEEKEKEQQKQTEEEKAKVEQQKAEVDKREKENFKENKTNSAKKEIQKNTNSSSKKTENSKKNKKNDNNNSSNKENTFEVEGDGYPTVLGNSGRFFSSKSEADNWAFAQLENDDSSWTKSGYRRFSTSQCKRNGRIGWTVNFRK